MSGVGDDFELRRQAMRYKFIYSMTGLFLGLACILAGLALGLAGAIGHTLWTASLLGLSTNLTDATPGVIVFVVGIFMVLMTRFRYIETVETIRAGKGSSAKGSSEWSRRSSNWPGPR
jgi:hypothetical protein